jgi:hypothetical protein
MKKKTILKLLISAGLATLVLLPQSHKELYVPETGHLKILNTNLLLILIAGLFYNWKFLKEILIILMVMVLFLSIANISFSFHGIMHSFPGWLINIAISGSLISFTLMLKKSERNFT